MATVLGDDSLIADSELSPRAALRLPVIHPEKFVSSAAKWLETHHSVRRYTAFVENAEDP
jgi:hypothetical protein